MNLKESLQFLDLFNQKKILVIGDIMLDTYSWGDINRLNPEESGSPLVNVKRDTHILGGAANVANNIRQLGGEVNLFGLLNPQDSSGEEIIKQCQDKGILLDYISDSRPTANKQRIMVRNRQIARIDREEITPIDPLNQKLLFERVINKIEESDCILFSDYNKGILTKSFCQEVILKAKKYDVPILADPKPENISFFYGSHLISPNKKEAEKILGRDLSKYSFVQLRTEIAQELCQRVNCQIAVITLGEEGVALFDQKEELSLYIPTFAREVEDVTGAGDTFIATLCLGIASKMGLKESVRVANIAAGYAVSKVGTYAVSKEDIVSHAQRLNFGRLYRRN